MAVSAQFEWHALRGDSPPVGGWKHRQCGDGALYRSTDGAEHWQPVSLPEGTNGPNGLPSIQSRQIVFTSPPGLERPENMERAEGFFFRRMAARAGSRCSKKIVTFTTSPLIRWTPMCFTRPALNRRPGDRQTAGCTGPVFLALTSSGDSG